MTASVELKSKKELIKQILTDYPETRDSDRVLQVLIWKKECGDSCLFFDSYLTTETTSADSITRLKRMIQRDPANAHLRGIDKSREEEAVREIFTGELNFPNS